MREPQYEYHCLPSYLYVFTLHSGELLSFRNSGYGKVRLHNSFSHRFSRAFSADLGPLLSIRLCKAVCTAPGRNLSREKYVQTEVKEEVSFHFLLTKYKEPYD